jgi:hypothetical protein
VCVPFQQTEEEDKRLAEALALRRKQTADDVKVQLMNLNVGLT